MNKFKWQSPIFILGNPRSGTSLLRLMLDSHNDICIPPESHFFLWLEERYSEWDNNLLDTYIDDLYASTKFETWNINKDELKQFLGSKVIESYAHLNSLIYHYYCVLQGRQVIYWGDKNSLWVDKLHKIPKHYPNAFFIHIIRDGRDVACSYRSLNSRIINSKYAPNLPNDIEEIAKAWISNIKGIEYFLRALNTQNIIQIRYEDLLKQPQKTLQSILNKIDLNFSKVQMQYYLKDKSNIEPSDFFVWKEKLVQPPDLSNIGKYKLQLSPEEINIFDTLAKKTLIKYGYL